jgi:hypothetical protein
VVARPEDVIVVEEELVDAVLAVVVEPLPPWPGMPTQI